MEFWDTNSSLAINGFGYLLLKNTRQIVHTFGRRHPPDHVALARQINATKDGTYAHPLIGQLGGVFTGLGNSISGLTIADGEDTSVGFVGQTTTYGTIRDISLLSANVSGTGTGQYIGTLVGSDESSRFAGAITTNCSATGSVSGGSGSVVGGLIGRIADALILNSRAAVDISLGQDGIGGGLVGYSNEGFIEVSYASGAVVAGDTASIGGLLGKSDSEGLIAGIENSYSTGAIAGAANSVSGGSIGVDASGWGTYVTAVYSVNSVTGGTGSTLGGLIGNDFSATNTDAYWDLDTSGISNPHQGAGNVPDDPGITGLTDAQMKSGLPAGFDPKVWAINPKINNGYPYLIDNPPPK